MTSRVATCTLAAAACSLVLAMTWSGMAGAYDNPRHADGYAQTTWATVHGDSSNSDEVLLDVPLELEPAWHILQGAGIWTAPSVAPDGTLYSTTGRGLGFSSLHAINPDGSIRWKAAPYEDADDLDSLAAVSCPVLGDDGDIYLGDSNQFWAFHPDGSVKWVRDLRELDIEGVFVTAIILGDKVGGVSTDGRVMLLDRADGALNTPVLDLPGGGAAVDSPKVRGLWDGGLVDPARAEMIWDILLGNVYEVANTPAVNPHNGRIYITGAGETEAGGNLYGIDLVDGELRIAFAADIPPNSGTSPAISADGKRIYAMAKGAVFALDADTGEKLWTLAADAQAASPSVGVDDVVYVLAGQNLVAIHGDSGKLAWQRNYADFAQERLPELWRRFGLLRTGKPNAYIDSVVTITDGVLWTSLLLGYELNLFGRHHHTPVETHLVALDPADGSVMASYPIPDTSEGGISVGPNGELYLDILAAQASIAYHGGYRWMLPSAAKIGEPKAGLYAFRPQ